MKKSLFAVIIFATVFSFSAEAFAADAAWTGGGADNKWSTGGNWNATPVPGTGDTATFNAAAGVSGTTVSVTTAPITIKNITFENPANTLSAYTIGAGGAKAETLTVNDAGAITMNNNLNTAGKAQTINANLTLLGDYSLVNDAGLSTNTLTVAGNITGPADPGKTLTLKGINSFATNFISGIIADNGANALAVTKDGANTWALSGLNTYTGATTINAGTLSLGANNVLPDGTAVTVNVSGTLDLNGYSDTIGSLNGIGTVTNNAAGWETLTLGDAGDSSFSGTIKEAGGGKCLTITKTGTSIMTLSGANSYSGGTNLQAGTIVLGNDACLGTGYLNLTGTSGTIKSTDDARKIKFLDLGSGALTVSGSNSLEITKTISGGGNIVINMTDTSKALTLSNATNSYTGGTNLVAGQLNINSTKAIGTVASILTISGGTIDNTSAGDITLANNNPQKWNGDFAFAGTNNLNLGTGAVTMNNDRQVTVTNNTLTVGGAIGDGGTGFGLTKAGAGTLAMSGAANTYTGTTTVNAGELDLNKAADTIAINGNLTIGDGTGGAKSDIVKLLADGQIKNTSAVLINGTSGKLDLNGKTQTIGSLGDTGTVTAGGSEAALGGGALTVGNTTSSTFSGAITGLGGTFTKQGTGTLKLAGTNTFSGGMTINAGTVQAASAGALGAGAVTNDATLDIGTTGVTGIGNYTQGAGAPATLKITVNSASNYGSLTSTAKAFITAANSILNINVGGSITNGTKLTVISTATGVDNVPGTITTSGQSNLSFTGSILGCDLILTAICSTINNLSVAGSTANPNAATVGAVLDSISNPSGDMATVINALNNLSTSQAASSLNSMTTTVDGSVVQSAISMLSQITNLTETHLENIHAAGPTGISTGDDYLHGLDIWAQGLGDYAHQDPRGFSNGYNATSWGAYGGADIPLNIGNDSLRIGVGSGYGQTFVRSKDSSGRNDIDSIPWTSYFSYKNSKYPLYLDAAFTFIYNIYNASRAVTVGTLTQRTASADYNGQQYSGYLEGGYSFFYRNLIMTPLVSFQYMHLHTTSYTETDADALNLTVNSQDYDMALTGFGVRAAYPLTLKYGTFTPDLHAKWLYDWVGDNQATTAAFAGGGTAFPTSGFRAARSGYDMGTKVSFKTKYNVSLDMDYDFLLKAQYYEHYGSVTVRYSF